MEDDKTQPDAGVGTNHPYEALKPALILDAVESLGGRCSGGLLALNSYENRVYRVDMEDAPSVVVKFYRPGRWSRAAIEEEHAFVAELAALEIPAVAPMERDGRSCFEFGGFYFAVYPNRGGRPPDLESREHRVWMGRFLGRIHRAGCVRPFRHRPTLSVEAFGEQSRTFLLDHGFIPPELERAYRTLTEDLLAWIDQAFGRCGHPRSIRLHGDCHPGNILWTDDGPHFVDFDDARMGPAVQDLWMLLSGEREEMGVQLSELLEGYREFQDFDPAELHLIEALRTLRMLHYAAWLARRWDDPAFPRSFPWFNTQRFWEEHILSLREQAGLLQEPPLALL